jgi:hypothetical protein
MPPPVLEHHILEDFNNHFSNFQGHVLSLARFLQDVAARRVGAARAMAAAPRTAPKRKAVAVSVIAATGDAAPAATPQQPAGGAAAAATATAVVAPGDAAAALARVFAPVHRPFRAPMAALLRGLMQTPCATLFFRGLEVPGGEAWFHRLSMAAADELLYGGVATVATHWLDTAPFPLTPAEAAAWQALQDEARPEAVHASGSHGSRVTRAVALSLATPPMTPAQAALQAADDAVWREYFLDMSATTPGVPLLVLRSRTGMALAQGDDQGVPRARPFHRDIDVRADRQRDVPPAHVARHVRAWAAAVGRSLAGSSFAAGGAAGAGA